MIIKTKNIEKSEDNHIFFVCLEIDVCKNV